MHFILEAFASQQDDVFSNIKAIVKQDIPNIKRHINITFTPI